jgi:putrescine transport system ATP-binding protein
MSDQAKPASVAKKDAASDARFLEIDRVTKKFDDMTAVDDVSISIRKGEIFALLGASGCGKSTLLRMLAGFEKPSSGSFRLNGQDVTSVAPYERPINMMFQSYALFPHLTVWENVAFGLKRDNLTASEIETRVKDVLELVQMSPFIKRKPHQLSGGQQQRVALARSLAKRPQLLLLDEPLGALDKKLREQTQVELVNILHQVGVTCVMVTHDQEEAMTMADRIAVMRNGKFLQVGRPGEIYETPSNKYVADFIGSVNLFPGKVIIDEPDHVVIQSTQCEHHVSHGITGTMGMDVNVALRPEKVCLSHKFPLPEERESPRDVNRNLVQGKIQNVTYFGSSTIYRVLLNGGQILKVQYSNDARHEERGLKLGDEVYAWWDGSDLVVLTQ